MAKLATMPHRLKAIDSRTIKLEPKRADSGLLTKEHRAWAAAVIKRAGYQCEACGRAGVRLFADHIEERRDNPARALDITNGQALCGSCHTRKTAATRQARLRA